MPAGTTLNCRLVYVLQLNSKEIKNLIQDQPLDYLIKSTLFCVRHSSFGIILCRMSSSFDWYDKKGSHTDMASKEVTRSSFTKKIPWKISQNSKGTTCTRVSLFNESTDQKPSMYWKKTRAFFCEFCEFFQNFF